MTDAPASGKRKVEEETAANGGGDAKRPKLDAAAPKPKPALDLSVLAKAKKALEKQKELKEKLARLKQASAAALLPAGAPPPAAPGVPLGAHGAPRPSTRLPPPLIVDDLGRQVGAAPAAVPAAAPRANPLLAYMEEEPVDDADAPHFDPSLGSRDGSRRARSALRFVDPGKFQRQAETHRLRAQFGDDYVRQLAERRRREEEDAAAAGGMDPNKIPLGVRVEAPKEEPETVPDVEWWDARILSDRKSYASELRLDRITLYIEHPVQVAPPAEAPPPPPQPLKLTKQELKKMRTQRRQAREQEKQELIRLGLLEPPKPKVKISNLMRVLGTEATADPTAIEAEVRRQMAERAAAHEDRNLARMLTPAERRKKKLNKLLDRREEAEDGSVVAPVVHQVAVYRVGNLSHPQLKFKVEMNAKENHLNGRAVCLPGAFCVVVVEGGTKPLRRYEKLMLNRINWNVGREQEGDDDEGEEMAGGGNGGGGGSDNYCRLVWSGVVKDKAFKGKFRTEEVRSEATGRRVFEEAGVGQYWDLAAASLPE